MQPYQCFDKPTLSSLGMSAHPGRCWYHLRGLIESIEVELLTARIMDMPLHYAEAYTVTKMSSRIPPFLSRKVCSSSCPCYDPRMSLELLVVNLLSCYDYQWLYCNCVDLMCYSWRKTSRPCILLLRLGLIALSDDPEYLVNTQRFINLPYRWSRVLPIGRETYCIRRCPDG